MYTCMFTYTGTGSQLVLTSCYILCVQSVGSVLLFVSSLVNHAIFFILAHVHLPRYSWFTRLLSASPCKIHSLWDFDFDT